MKRQLEQFPFCPSPPGPLESWPVKPNLQIIWTEHDSQLTRLLDLLSWCSFVRKGSYQIPEVHTSVTSNKTLLRSSSDGNRNEDQSVWALQAYNGPDGEHWNARINRFQRLHASWSRHHWVSLEANLSYIYYIRFLPAHVPWRIVQNQELCRSTTSISTLIGEGPSPCP